MKQIVIADALLEIDKVRKICVDKSKPDSNWHNLLVFVSQYIHDIVSIPSFFMFVYHECKYRNYNIKLLSLCKGEKK